MSVALGSYNPISQLTDHLLQMLFYLKVKILKKLLKDFKIVIPLILLIPSLLLNVYFLNLNNKKTSPGNSTNKQVTRIIDGDTFDVEGNTRIRLAGADAPEYPKGCLSEQSKIRLSELILGKSVEIEEVEKDSFGRTVAFVFQDDLSIDQTVVSEGLAKAASENESEYSSLLLGREDEAQKAKRGIWSDLCTQPSKPECKIKGNTRKGIGKIYHLPDCYNYDKIVINENDGDEWFCSETQAQSWGFRKSSDCPESP